LKKGGATVIDFIFILVLGGILCFLFRWGFKSLPAENWQILASLPREKQGDGAWKGLNLTYYGFFNATALGLAVAMWVVLLGSLGISPLKTAVIGIPLVILGFLASRWIARWVEKKRYTSTIGGASFVIILLSPAVVALAERILPTPPVHALTVLAAISTAYALGEGVGRLACISFGCCYGKPLAASHPVLQRVFARWNFIFSGQTKKIAYAHGLDGQQVIPIQGVTALLYSAVSLLGVFLFLKGWYGPAFLLCLSVTQIWRVVSEFFRADYRGGGSISAYQVMAFLAIVYGFFLAAVLPSPPLHSTDLRSGLHSLLSPGMILFLQALWVAAFLFTGRSNVTASTISFHVVKERV
jgi:hypothetical protein